ncbi:MAG: hypothetical protein OXK73_15990 [Rhodospirillaceae bacterium]|nr:hypothetical protein [Rhodospirillaceae bacterium]
MSIDVERSVVVMGPRFVRCLIQPRADIVVLNRDPLADLSALRDIETVFRDGAVLWKQPS